MWMQWTNLFIIKSCLAYSVTHQIQLLSNVGRWPSPILRIRTLCLCIYLQTWSHDWRYVPHLTTNTHPSKRTHSDMKPNSSKGRLKDKPLVLRCRKSPQGTCSPMLLPSTGRRNMFIWMSKKAFFHKMFWFTLLLGGTFNHACYS